MSAKGAAGGGATDSGARPSGERVFVPHPGGMADTIGRSIGGHRPVLAGVVLWLIALVAVGAAMVGLGLLLTHILLGAGLGRVEAGWSRWFVLERTPTLNTVTRIGSDLGSTLVVLAVSAFATIVLAVRKHWRQIGFLLFGLTLEFALFLVTVTFVGRHRPTVAHLDAGQPTSSFPSGHTAASLTLYVGLAIVLYSLLHRGLVRRFVTVLAVLLPMFVGISRVYRGMHFATDVIAGVLLGCGALLFAVLATRSEVAASSKRAQRESSQPPAEPPVEAAA